MFLGSCLLVSGCALTEKIFGVDTDYAITGQTNDEDAEDYLNKILNERVKEDTQALSEDSEIRQRQEDYMEQAVQASLLKALEAKGYYAANVAFKNGAKPLSGQYDITYGPKFSIEDASIIPSTYGTIPITLRPEQPLDAETVLKSQSAFSQDAQKGHCYFSFDVRNEVYLHKDRNSGTIHFVVDAGKEGTFGPVNFQGNGSVKESYLRKLLPWKEGKCFQRGKIEDYKTSLLQSGLFAKADAVLPEGPAADGSVPVTMDLRERAHRSIGAGLTYYSDEGPGATFSWEHRNFLGAAEKLKTELTLSALKQSLDTDFTKPYFIRKDQSLSLSASLRRQDTDAYQEMGIDSGIALNRNFTRRLSGSTGVNLTLTKITDETDESENVYGLVSLPQSLTYDSRDDKLDPHKGWNLNASAAPFFDVLGESSPFFKTYFSGSHYLDLGTKADLVLASKAGYGTIWGTGLEDVPATERFYAGGGGSVRGFGYQEVGPQEDGDPTGGRSIINFSLEMRSKFTQSFGMAAFVDGASLSEKTTPEFSDVAIGAGLGMRYYTSFGPIRFDIAVPLTQKDDLDQNYQFYISIGQAF